MQTMTIQCSGVFSCARAHTIATHHCTCTAARPPPEAPAREWCCTRPQHQARQPRAPRRRAAIARLARNARPKQLDRELPGTDATWCSLPPCSQPAEASAATAVMGIDDAVAISVEVEANVLASRTAMVRRDEAASCHDDVRRTWRAAAQESRGHGHGGPKTGAQRSCSSRCHWPICPRSHPPRPRTI
jgi:hypothetical protein